jgi:hypothetical protein
VLFRSCHRSATIALDTACHSIHHRKLFPVGSDFDIWQSSFCIDLHMFSRQFRRLACNRPCMRPDNLSKWRRPRNFVDTYNIGVEIVSQRLPSCCTQNGRWEVGGRRCGGRGLIDGRISGQSAGGVHFAWEFFDQRECTALYLLDFASLHFEDAAIANGQSTRIADGIGGHWT